MSDKPWAQLTFSFSSDEWAPELFEDERAMKIEFLRKLAFEFQDALERNDEEILDTLVRHVDVELHD